MIWFSSQFPCVMIIYLTRAVVSRRARFFSFSETWSSTMNQEQKTAKIQSKWPHAFDVHWINIAFYCIVAIPPRVYTYLFARTLHHAIAHPSSFPMPWMYNILYDIILHMFMQRQILHSKPTPLPLPLGAQVAIRDHWCKTLLVTFVAATWCSSDYLITVWINTFTTGKPFARYIH